MRRRGFHPTPPASVGSAGEAFPGPPPARHAARALAGLAALGALGLGGIGLSACTDETSPEEGTDAAIYAEVLRHVNDVPTVDEAPLLFVRPVAGHTIDLSVQAKVVKALDDVATVRFVDEDDEVVLVDEPLEPVRDDGVVVTIGAIARVGSRAEVVAERYVDRRHVRELCVALRQVGDAWQPVDEACRLPG
jgi:hypothetical protein